MNTTNHQTFLKHVRKYLPEQGSQMASTNNTTMTRTTGQQSGLTESTKINYNRTVLEWPLKFLRLKRFCGASILAAIQQQTKERGSLMKQKRERIR